MSFKRYLTSTFVLCTAVFICAPVGDSLIKRKTIEKYLEAYDVYMDVSENQNIYLYNIENPLPTISELEAAETSGGRDNEAKRKMIYTGLINMSNNDNKFLRNFYKTLKITGYVDTVNRLFVDNINLIMLSPKIERINLYTIGGKKNSKPTARAKMYISWYLRNCFDEVTDTIESTGFSGSYTSEYSSVAEYFDNYPQLRNQMLQEAFTNALTNLHSNKTFDKRIKYEADYTINDSLLILSVQNSFVTDKSDAGLACVAVKTKENHGSGFAITKDGYIVTSYHTIEDAVTDKKDEVTLITATGEETKGKIIRYNRFRNLALLKTEKQFEKVFKIPSEKAFKNLQDVLTIGTPKSIELGQSISAGIISAERKINNNYFIQLNMSINSGNSGGPLFDAAGSLYGMIVAKLIGKNTEGVSFAVPAFLLEHHLKIKLK